MIDLENKTYGGYALGPVIGTGSYGEVRYAKHIKTGKQVAIKIVDLCCVRDASSNIMKEIRILKSLNHINCIKIFEVQEQVSYTGRFCKHSCACTELKSFKSGICSTCEHSSMDHGEEETRDVMFIIQELAPVGDLFGLLMHCGAFNDDLARYYFKQLIKGIEHLHERGIIHRDLKPENLVLCSEFKLKIIDFGLAASSAESSFTNESQIDDPHELSGDDLGRLYSCVGSQPYSAPEVYYNKQLHNNLGYQGKSADVWSLGVILFIMLTGRPPFLRPLLKTYDANHRRCKHFCRLINGSYPDTITPSAQDLLQRIFQINPKKRITIDKIKQHPWLNGHELSNTQISKLMEEKSKSVWYNQRNYQMFDILTKLRQTHNHDLDSHTDDESGDEFESGDEHESFAKLVAETTEFKITSSPSPVVRNKDFTLRQKKIDDDFKLDRFSQNDKTNHNHTQLKKLKSVSSFGNKSQKLK